MFKDNLKKLREDAKLTQEELAQKLYVSRSAVAKWEQGRGIPKEETIEDIAKVFAISVDSFYGTNEPQKVIEKIERKSRKNLAIVIAVAIIIFTLILVFVKNRNDLNVEYDKFYSEKTLKSYGLEYLRPITLNSEGSVNYNDAYYVNIKGYDVFYEYINYLLRFLQESPEIEYYGFEIEKPIEGSSILDEKSYILKSDNLEDYKTSFYNTFSKSIHYNFYYLTKLDNDRGNKEKLNFNYIRISYLDPVFSWIKVNDIQFNTNFRMQLRSTEYYGYGDYYLFEEHFDFEKIDINQENFHDYFTIACNTSNPGYSWYTVEYLEEYYFRAYFPLTLEIGEGEDFESDNTIVYSPVNGNYIKLIKAYGEFDLDTNTIKYKYNVIVEDGYIYRVKKE